MSKLKVEFPPRLRPPQHDVPTVPSDITRLRVTGRKCGRGRFVTVAEAWFYPQSSKCSVLCSVCTLVAFIRHFLAL